MTQDEVDAYCERTAASNLPQHARKGVRGVGVNDLHHTTMFIDAEGKARHHSGYVQWCRMLERGYSGKYKTTRPTYVGVTVCNDWKNASSFTSWQKTQYREEGWQLDKDLLVVGNKVYSPETCICVPSWLNSFTADSMAKRGDCLIGVTWDTQQSMYLSRCRNPVTDKREYLGRFTSEMEAHLVWRKRKLEIALELKPKMDAIDTRIYPNIIIIVNATK